MEEENTAGDGEALIENGKAGRVLKKWNICWKKNNQASSCGNPQLGKGELWAMG